MWDFIKTAPQYILPKHFLSFCMHGLARWRWPPWKNLVIRLFVRYYAVDMQAAEQSAPESYRSFNEFFTRPLKADARPLIDTPLSVASPADGTIAQIGAIKEQRIVQAKGRDFSLPLLLANDTDSVRCFGGGKFATLYLAPRDYHRIHMPVNARLLKMTYVPGDLFSVNEATSRVVSGLFARNERLVCLFDTQFGRMAVILVGAVFVGSMETVWQGEVTPTGKREIQVWDYASRSDTRTGFAKGEELGRFNMGSTVILLFEEQRVGWAEQLGAGSRVNMGELIGYARA